MNAAELSEAEIREELRRREERFRRELRAASRIARTLEGCSMDAVILGIRDQCLMSMDWPGVVRAVKLRQLDIEDLAVQAKLRAARKKSNATLAAYAGEPSMDLWMAHRRASGRQDKLWERQEAIWREREELMKS